MKKVIMAPIGPKEIASLRMLGASGEVPLAVKKLIDNKFAKVMSDPYAMTAVQRAQYEQELRIAEKKRDAIYKVIDETGGPLTVMRGMAAKMLGLNDKYSAMCQELTVLEKEIQNREGAMNLGEFSAFKRQEVQQVVAERVVRASQENDAVLRVRFSANDTVNKIVGNARLDEIREKRKTIAAKYNIQRAQPKTFG